MRSATTKKASAREISKFRDLARSVIEHHFGSRPARITRKGGGLSNFVFEVKHAEGDFIVRLSPEQGRLNAFVKEQWCERAVRREGVPTAEILETGFSIVHYPYVIARSVAGRQAVNHPEQMRIVRELGRLSSKINSIRTNGFGETFDWSNNELSRNSSLKDYLEGEYRIDERIETLERSKLCSRSTIASLKKVCREMRGLKVRPTLNHGDLRLKNVIADDDGRIRAIIDWDKATSNIAPHWELSVALHDLGIDMKHEFVRGYGLTPKRFAPIAPFVKALNLINYSDAINRAREGKDKPELERLRGCLSGDFDLYSF